jgi:hypothetical protein
VKQQALRRVRRRAFLLWVLKLRHSGRSSNTVVRTIQRIYL